MLRVADVARCRCCALLWLRRVQVSGIYRAVPMREKTNARTLKSVFKTYVDVIHYRKVRADGSRLLVPRRAWRIRSTL